MNEDRSVRYHRLKRRASAASLAWTVALLAGLSATSATVWLRSTVQAVAGEPASSGPSSLLIVALYVVFLAGLSEAGSLPISFYSGFLVERRYGLSNQTLAAWLADQAKAFLLTLVLSVGAAMLIYAFIARMPSGWWLPTGLAFALVIVLLANLAPVLLLPLFYRIKPLEQESLQRRIMALADRSGTRVLGAYELGLGEKTKKANAALTGVGTTRRILVSDTMLADYSEEEIEVVLAHEMAHHVHGDIWKGIVLEGVLMLAGFFVAARVLEAATGPLGLASPADVAGLPVLLLSAGAVSLVMMPVAHALSRANERSADRFALELTKNPGAFVSAMRRLGAQNLAEEAPSRITQWLFYSHPPLSERIAAAQRFGGSTGLVNSQSRVSH